MLLIAGGYKDPNIQWLLEQAAHSGIKTLPLLTKKNSNPSISWDLENGELSVNEKLVKISAAFVRRDVFHKSGEEGIFRASSWYSTLNGWLASNSDVKILNRKYLDRFTNKPQTLFLAKKSGLRIPDTLISNELEHIGKQRRNVNVAKPVNGGGFCQEVDVLINNTELRNGKAANPAIIQQKIVGPDIRIYRIGQQYVGFQIESNALDYRLTKKREIQYLEKLPFPLLKKLGKLMDQLGLDWGAADFKYDTKTNKYFFLEVNSNPMFSVFDRISEGKLSSSIIRVLNAESTAF